MARKKREARRDTFVLLDGSYVIYHRYFATKRYFTMSHKSAGKEEMDALTRTSNPDFAEAYTRLFEKEIHKISEPKGESYSIPYENIIFVYDCMRKDNWRMAEFAEYKAQRCAKRKNFDDTVFDLTFGKIIPQLQESKRLRVLKHGSIEADDIIGIVKADIRRRAPEADIIVITNDNDYLPMWDPKTVIMNLHKEGRNLVDRAMKSSGVAVEELGKFILTKKILNGDPSDNIPPLIKGESDSFYKELSLNPDRLASEIATRNISAGYEKNRRLIDLNCVPEQYKDEVLEQWWSLEML